MTKPVELFYADIPKEAAKEGVQTTLDAILSRYASDMKSGTHLEQKHQQAIKEIEGLIVAELEAVKRLKSGLIFQFDGGVRLYTDNKERDAEFNKASDEKIAKQQAEYDGFNSAWKLVKEHIDDRIKEYNESI